MTGPLADLSGRFAFNGKLLSLLLDDFEGDDWRHRAGCSNHAQWLLGHLANTRRWMLREFGQSVQEDGWEPLFGAGERPTAESDALDTALLKQAFAGAGEQLVAALATMTDEQAAREIPQAFPDGSKTVGGMAHFLYFHEVYHLGQLGLLRRSADKPGLI